MIESVELFRTLLRSKYELINSELLHIRVGNFDFRDIMDEYLVTSSLESPGNYLMSCTNIPLRMQFKDISGIGANAFGFYLGHLWAVDAFTKWDQVVVLPMLTLTEENVIESIRRACFEYLGEEVSPNIFIETFFQSALFVISGSTNFNARARANLLELEGLGSNILVLSDATQRYESLNYISLMIGLRAPEGQLLFDDGATVKIDGLMTLSIEREVRSFSLRSDAVPGSIIDQTNPFMAISEEVEDKIGDKILQMRGREHRFSHRVKFVVDFEELIDQLYRKLILQEEGGVFYKYLADSPNSIKDCFAAAVTSPTVGILTYNIAGRLVIRNLKNNYVSYAGTVKKVKDNIVEKLVCAIQEKHQDVSQEGKIPEDRWKVIVQNQVSKCLKDEARIDVTSHKKSQSVTQGTLLSSDLKRSDILTEEGIQDIGYMDLDQRIREKGGLNERLRDILKNQVSEENIPEEFYILLACLLIAEVSRNHATFLPSMMLLDLCERGVEYDVISWEWDTLVSQECLLDDFNYDPLEVVSRCYGDFRGMHPMTHDGSYFQSVNVCATSLEDRSSLLCLVEFKSVSIMMDWLYLSCKIKPMEAAYKEVYNAEIWPRYTGRLSKTNVIDPSIDYMLVEFQNKDSADFVWKGELSHKFEYFKSRYKGGVEFERHIPDGFVDVDDDGLCFYNAIVRQYDTGYTAPELRDQAIQHILHNPVDYVSFLAEEYKGNAFEQLNYYVDQHMRRDDGTNPWADELMIHATTHVITRNIEVVRFNVNAERIDGDRTYGEFDGDAIVVGNINNVHFVAQAASETVTDGERDAINKLTFIGSSDVRHNNFQNIKDGFGKEVAIHLVDSIDWKMNVNAALFGGSLMKTMEIKVAIKYLLKNYISILPTINSYLNDTLVGNFISENENIISTGLHFLGGTILTYYLIGNTGITHNLKCLTIPAFASTTYGINQYSYDYRATLLSHLNGYQSQTTKEKVLKFLTYVGIDIAITLLMSTPYGISIGFSSKLLYYPIM